MDFLGLIKQAKAQGADALASPTFSFTPPNGGTVIDTTTDKYSIKLDTNSTQINVGETVKVRIVIESQEESINGFNVAISFDPEYFQVEDSDSTETGIQISYLDTVFDLETNSVNNSTGLITLKTSIEEPSSVSRTVAEIELIAIKSGSSEIEVVKDSSSIVSTAGVDLLDEVNSINFNISTQTTQDTTQTTTTTSFIPKAGINDYSGLILAVLLGLLLVIIGIYLLKLPRKHAGS